MTDASSPAKTGPVVTSSTRQPLRYPSSWFAFSQGTVSHGGLP
jgi:hypothetical protein